MSKLSQIIQILISIFLIIFILLQQRGAAMGSAFGRFGISYFKRRGIEKFLFWASIILATFFILNSILGMKF